MDFSQIKKWMKKMDQILDLYGNQDDFTFTEKSVLLDYAKRIHAQIQKIQIIEEEVPDEVDETLMASQIMPLSVIEVAKLHEKEAEVEEKPNVIATPSESTNEIVETKVDFIKKYEKLFDHLKVTALSEKLELTPINDLRFGLGLNERIVAQNQLFLGDKEGFELCMNHLNSLSSFNEAKYYLCEQIIPKYEWDQPTKEVNVDKFIRFISRKYL
ncbi:MAG: hypothetical protein M3Q56_02090 [Bacteroidota bacterium]|nr:hypothetical protein [Bacteroidota bacterium]